jgi:hypothetical protein
MLDTLTLSRLASEGEIIAVRNTQPGITVFSDPQLNHTTEWAGDGDLNGGHIREVPAIYLRNPEFRQNLQRGIFVIEEAPEALAEAIQAQQAEWASRQQAKADSAKTLERMADRTVGRGKTCIAPKGKDLCGNITLAMGAKADERPPLCPEHSHMVNEFVAVATGQIKDGKEEMGWRRAKFAGATR